MYHMSLRSQHGFSAFVSILLCHRSGFLRYSKSRLGIPRESKRWVETQRKPQESSFYYANYLWWFQMWALYGFGTTLVLVLVVEPVLPLSPATPHLNAHQRPHLKEAGRFFFPLLRPAGVKRRVPDKPLSEEESIDEVLLQPGGLLMKRRETGPVRETVRVGSGRMRKGKRKGTTTHR